MARRRDWEYTDEAGDDAAKPAVPCWLCERPMGEKVEWHHPIPKSRGGRDKVQVHPICHQALHANFTNSELGRIGDDLAVLKANDAMAKFLSWVEGKDPDFHAPTAKKGKR